jgi:hypothetical protein
MSPQQLPGLDPRPSTQQCPPRRGRCPWLPIRRQQPPKTIITIICTCRAAMRRQRLCTIRRPSQSWTGITDSRVRPQRYSRGRHLSPGSARTCSGNTSCNMGCEEKWRSLVFQDEQIAMKTFKRSMKDFHFACCLTGSLTNKRGSVPSSEVFVNAYRTARCHISEASARLITVQCKLYSRTFVLNNWIQWFIIIFVIIMIINIVTVHFDFVSAS